MSSAKSGNPVLVGQLDYQCTNCVANAPNLVLVGRICRNPERPNFSIVISVAIAIVMVIVIVIVIVLVIVVVIVIVIAIVIVRVI